jgi:hypothetical protein
MGREERANGRCLAAACHLPHNHRHVVRQWQRYGITDVSIYSYLSQLDVGFLVFSQRRKHLGVTNKAYRELLGHHHWMPCRLEGCVFNRGWTICRACLLTVHDHVHILDKTVDDLESLTCSSPSLIVRKSIQSLEAASTSFSPKAFFTNLTA